MTEFLAIPILRNHIDFLIDRHAWFATLDEKPEEFGELLSTEWTHSVMSSVVSKGTGHLTQVCEYYISHVMPDCSFRAIAFGIYNEIGSLNNWRWHVRPKSEPHLLELIPFPHKLNSRQALIETVDKFILARLQQPHSSNSSLSYLQYNLPDPIYRP